MSTGPNLVWDSGNNVGFSHINFSTTVADIKDGTANTIAMAEGLIGDNNNSVYNASDLVRGIALTGVSTQFATPAQLTTYGVACAAGVSNHHSHAGREWISGMANQTLFNTLAPPNWKYPTCFECVGCGWTDGRGVYPSRAQHTGGTHHLFADGRVRFVNSNIDTVTYQRLGSKASKDVAQLDE